MSKNMFDIEYLIRQIESAANDGFGYDKIAAQAGFSIMHLYRIRLKKRSPQIKDAKKILQAIEVLKNARKEKLRNSGNLG